MEKKRSVEFITIGILTLTIWLCGCQKDKSQVKTNDNMVIVASILNTENDVKALEEVLDENNIPFLCWGSAGFSVGVSKKDLEKVRQVIQKAVNDGKLDEHTHIYEKEIPVSK